MPDRPLSSRGTLIGGFRGRQDDYERRRGAHPTPRSYGYARACARASGDKAARAAAFFNSRGCAATVSLQTFIIAAAAVAKNIPGGCTRDPEHIPGGYGTDPDHEED